MYAILYLFRGFTLIWYLLSPSYRQKTNARWKTTRPSRLILEIGTGILGLFIFAVLVTALLWKILPFS